MAKSDADTSKWEAVASGGDCMYLIDTKEPNPKAKGDTMARLLNIDTKQISPPLSLGSLVKQGYWDELMPGEAPEAKYLVQGAREVTDPTWETYTGVEF